MLLSRERQKSVQLHKFLKYQCEHQPATWMTSHSSMSVVAFREEVVYTLCTQLVITASSLYEYYILYFTYTCRIYNIES